MTHRVTISLSRRKMERAGVEIILLPDSVELTFEASEDKFIAMTSAAEILAEASFARPDIDQLLDELTALENTRMLMRLRG